MSALKNFFKKNEKHFVNDGRYSRLFPIFELVYTFLYTPGTVTKGNCHVRDFLDLKRLMSFVYIALVPCILFACYNTGLQIHLAFEKTGVLNSNIRTDIMKYICSDFSSKSFIFCFIHGALYFLPIYIVTLAAGGLCECIFAIVRKHEISEGFLITSILFPLTLPPNIDLWLVAIGISFGIVIGKEIFGGVGRNFLNPALLSRAFLFFSYPTKITGDKVWVAVDSYSMATALGALQDASIGSVDSIKFIKNMDFNYWVQCFVGFIPGSLGETSTLLVILGFLFMLITGVVSWRITLSMCLGAFFMSGVCNLLYYSGFSSNIALSLPFYWHFVLGSFAFGAVFMATDPVSAPYINQSRYIYGFIIGVLVIVVRVINPAYPEGVFLAILFGNIIGPVIDLFLIKKNIKRRRVNYGS